MEEHPHVHLSTVVEVLGYTRQYCDILMKRIEAEGELVRGGPDGSSRGWHLPGYTGLATPIKTPRSAREQAVLDFIDAYTYAPMKPEWDATISRMRQDGKLQSPYKGVYVRPGEVPRMGALLRGSTTTRFIKERVLANIEMYERTYHSEVVTEFNSTNLRVGAAVVRLRNQGIIWHPGRYLTQFTEYGKKMLAQERRFNPTPGVFTPFPVDEGDDDDL